MRSREDSLLMMVSGLGDVGEDRRGERIIGLRVLSVARRFIVLSGQPCFVGF